MWGDRFAGAIPVEGRLMRRVVTALVLVVVAMSIVACSSGGTTPAETGTPVPAAGTVVTPAAPAGN